MHQSPKAAWPLVASAYCTQCSVTTVFRAKVLLGYCMPVGLRVGCAGRHCVPWLCGRRTDGVFAIICAIGGFHASGAVCLSLRCTALRCGHGSEGAGHASPVVLFALDNAHGVGQLTTAVAWQPVCLPICLSACLPACL
jgi:hypothetical protein